MTIYASGYNKWHASDKKKLQQETRNNEDEECDEMWKRNTGDQFILKFYQKCHNILLHSL
jgi:hypothetical protein